MLDRSRYPSRPVRNRTLGADTWDTDIPYGIGVDIWQRFAIDVRLTCSCYAVIPAGYDVGGGPWCVFGFVRYTRRRISVDNDGWRTGGDRWRTTPFCPVAGWFRDGKKQTGTFRIIRLFFFHCVLFLLKLKLNRSLKRTTPPTDDTPEPLLLLLLLLFGLLLAWFLIFHFSNRTEICHTKTHTRTHNLHYGANDKETVVVRPPERERDRKKNK